MALRRKKTQDKRNKTRGDTRDEKAIETPVREIRGIPRTYDFPLQRADDRAWQDEKTEEVETLPPPPWLSWAICVAIPVLAGAFAIALTFPFVAAYARFVKPPFAASPQTLAWTAIAVEAAMGLACHFIWKAPASRLRTSAFTSCVILGALHFAWPLLLFHFGLLLAAALGAILLAIAAYLAIDNLERLHSSAAWLLLPHFFFAAYLAYLSTGIALLN